MSRFSRKNRTSSDLGLKGRGGLFDAFDNAFKSAYRINDAEYDFICEHCTDEELDILLDDGGKFSKAKQQLIIVDKMLKQMHP